MGTLLLCKRFKVLIFYPRPSSPATIRSSRVELCKYAEFAHMGANNEQPVQECRMSLEVLSELERTTNSAEAGMTAAIADTLPATVVEQQYEPLHCTGWSVAKHLFAKCGQCGTNHRSS